MVEQTMKNWNFCGPIDLAMWLCVTKNKLAKFSNEFKFHSEHKVGEKLLEF